MALFTVRVDIVKSTNFPNQINQLNAAMIKQGFGIAIANNKGFRFRLPQGEYVLEGNYTIEYTKSAIIIAVSSVKNIQYSFLINEVLKMDFDGLQSF